MSLATFDAPRAVAFDKGALRKDIAKEGKRKARAKASRLKAEIKAARASRKPALAAVRSACAVERVQVRTVCRERLAMVREQIADIIARARLELETDKKDARELRAAARFGKAFSAKGPKVGKAIRRSESDDAVRAEIDPYLVPYFDHVRSSIKGTLHMSRAEAFMHHVEESPDDVAAFLADNADDQVDAMIAEYNRRTNPPERRSPLQIAKGFLLGRDVIAAIGSVRDGEFGGGHPGTYRITGLTAQTVVISPVRPSTREDLPETVAKDRSASIRLDTGMSRVGDHSVATMVRPDCMRAIRDAFAGRAPSLIANYVQPADTGIPASPAPLSPRMVESQRVHTESVARYQAEAPALERARQEQIAEDGAAFRAAYDEARAARAVSDAAERRLAELRAQAAAPAPRARKLSASERTSPMFDADESSGSRQVTMFGRKNPGGRAPRTADERAAVKDYEDLHWGNPGKKQIATGKFPTVDGPLVVLGVLKYVEYYADKKGDGPSIYEHDFERGSEGPFGRGLAKLCRNEAGGLVIVGGGYVVEDRGIVG